MASDTRKAFLDELGRHSPKLRVAFEAAISDVRSTSQLRLIDEAIKRAIESGNIARGTQEVVAALNLGPEFFAPLDKAISDAFYAGGAYQLSLLPKKPLPDIGQLVVRFKGRHPRAEALARNMAADLIDEISDDTRSVIQGAVTEAVERKKRYRDVTRQLIGIPENGRLKGGLIGLHSTQAEAVRKARLELESLDPKYLLRERRDQRFDGAIRRAIASKKPLSKAYVDKVIGKYSDRLLRLRGETISRTEANKALNAGRAEAIAQMIEDRQIPPEAVLKIWDATPDSRTRDSHRALSGMSVPWGDKFKSPVTGALLDWPHDQNADASETINCRCTCRFRIDWVMVAKWQENQGAMAA